ncbi:MAG TPA: hypothetical protein VEU94_00090, partial [Terriglobales bacterium]|nr:hypothetical protein [Terriglobales bacterium]
LAIPSVQAIHQTAPVLATIGSGTPFTLLRLAISSAMADFSAPDNILAASGNTNSSSMLMCRLYIASRLVTAA